MGVISIPIVRGLVSERLASEVNEVIDISRQGFDLVIRSSCEVVSTIFVEQLEKRLSSQTFKAMVVGSLSELNTLGDRRSLSNDGRVSAILVSNDVLPCGTGFVPYVLPSPEILVPSLSVAVSKILNYYGQSAYVEAFDGAIISELRSLLRTEGLLGVIDGVVLAAFHGGYHGRSKKAVDAVGLVARASKKSSLAQMSGELSLLIEKMLSLMLVKQCHPHTFLKATLSFFVVCQQGKSIAEASRFLSVSRTTLQGHLRLAKKLGIDAMFTDGK